MSQRDEELVEVVRQYTHLWDKTHALFRNKNAKNNAWATIADIMHISAAQAINRWTTLKARYVKERKRALESRSGTAGPAATFSQMAHLQTTSEVSDTLATIMGMVEDAPPSPNEENQASTPQADAGTQGQPERPESQGASSLPEKRFAHRRRQLLRRGNASRGVRVPVQVQIYKQMLGKVDELIRFITQPEVENEDILFGRALAMSLSHVFNVPAL
ncbi:unnamed protein product [Acanthoscelides obtectus]|uniref:MADF domain-containing protein n=1 Tax=Acanthoscelides obtectus TaxID=200917 RepID=A0A9P0QA34_ACAOB|nr:unnamed protein product [Acanthoscelides obtectus]CAK1671590.1 hypothetical protein AOBTE_LOCUS28345 [Acanthoscelides obtectus]